MSITDKLEQIGRQMISKNYKFTKQREIIARALLEQESCRPSAEEIFHHINKTPSKIARATVYRTMELLAEIGIVLKLNFDKGITRFYFRGDGYNHMHHYLSCAICGNVEEIKEDWLTEVEKRLEQEYEFKVIDHLLIFKGIHETGLHTQSERLSLIHCSCNHEDKARFFPTQQVEEERGCSRAAL
ncbi:Fur family transcriptional regulator [Paenibacillus sp. HW567]|uniref:Fur family transcriptional regulator n=1 Tax=Paenibacillus sp. HW567 TaxID=1034769 RepID=UPI0003760C10|nr:transcriptional repressor [Paenibacillus sp. HW567]